MTCTERPQELGHLIKSLEKQQAEPDKPVLQTALALFGRKEAASGQAAGSGQEQAQEQGQGGSAQQAEESQGSGTAPPAGSIQAVALEWGEEGYKR